jgi:[ribosomal protein S5]-alanine N-acetyltransferase
VPLAPVIVSERLFLVSLLEETIEALIDGELEAAGNLQALSFSSEFVDVLGQEFLEVHLRRMHERGSMSGWFLRAVVRKDDATIIGDCGFHGHPRDVGRAEIGYRIMPRYRDNGYASEAASALVEWAREQGEPSVFATVQAANHASLRVVEKVGLAPVDERSADPIRAELVFKIDF